ncbi:MAG: hypothetical protein IJB96_00100 [Lachnospira sp.]|nr:hypothetical protein [Lachnospira sp.]
MYYTSSGAYRKTKMFIDYANVFLTLCIVVLFVCILVFKDWQNILFPVVFFTGAALNLGCAVKRFIEKQKAGAIIRMVIMVALIVLGLLCLLSMI